jgi:hypothetical protein
VDGVGEGELEVIGVDGEVEAGGGVDPDGERAAGDDAAAAVGALGEVLQGEVGDAAAGLPVEDVGEGGGEGDGDGAVLEAADAGGVGLELGAGEVEAEVAHEQRREAVAAHAQAAAGGEAQLLAIEAEADRRAEAEAEVARSEARDDEAGEGGRLRHVRGGGAVAGRSRRVVGHVLV